MPSGQQINGRQLSLIFTQTSFDVFTSLTTSVDPCHFVHHHLLAMPRLQFAARQNSFFRVPERRFLDRVILDTDVQEALSKREFAKVRALLLNAFRQEFTSPASGESEKTYRNRRRWAAKHRKEAITRILPETEEQWQARMDRLPNVRVLPSIFTLRVAVNVVDL